MFWRHAQGLEILKSRPSVVVHVESNDPRVAPTKLGQQLLALSEESGLARAFAPENETNLLAHNRLRYRGDDEVIKKVSVAFGRGSRGGGP